MLPLEQLKLMCKHGQNCLPCLLHAQQALKARGSPGGELCAAAGAPTFRELVSRVRSTVLSAVANAALPFACVLQAAGVPGSTANAPVFTTAVHVPDAAEGAAARDALHGAGLDASPVEACWPCAKSQLTHIGFGRHAAPWGTAWVPCWCLFSGCVSVQMRAACHSQCPHPLLLEAAMLAAWL